MNALIHAEHPDALPRALAALRGGKLIVIPTDTVYGLAALPWDAAAIARLYEVKGRERRKPIPLLLGERGQLEKVAAEVPRCAIALANAFWPGPLTIVVPKAPTIPTSLSPFPTIGVRMPAHEFALRLLQAAGPLAVTSANISASPPALTAAEAQRQLGDKVALIVDGGKAPGGIASTVVDCSGNFPRILRPGPIPEEQIRAVVTNRKPPVKP